MTKEPSARTYETRDLTTIARAVGLPAWFKSIRYVLIGQYYAPHVRRFMTSLHAINPSLNGAFMEYLTSYIWSRELGIPFEDRYYARRCAPSAPDRSTCAEYDAAKQWWDAQCRAFEVGQLAAQMDRAILQILIASFSHSLAYGLLCVPDATRMIDIVQHNLRIFTAEVIPAIHQMIRWFPRDATFNVTLARADILGEADVIAGSHIVEIKTTKNAAPAHRHTAQLLGYVCLATQRITHIDLMNVLRGTIHSADISHITEADRAQYASELVAHNTQTV